MKYLAHLIVIALLFVGGVFFVPLNETDVFGINPVLGLMFLIPGVWLLGLIFRRAA